MIIRDLAAGKIQGIKIYHSTPEISHLFFVDDNILFCRASHMDGLSIGGILASYKKVTGQQVNFDKSNICFSHIVDAD